MQNRWSDRCFLIALYVSLTLLALTATAAHGQLAEAADASDSAAAPASEPLVARQVEHLGAFARLYGYVKHFHPSDQASSIDWDAFAVHGAAKVLPAESRDELQATLRQLFLPLGPGIEILEMEEEPAEAAEPPPDDADLELVAWQHQGY
jgi:hypothetical protein